ncbi:MAG: cytochrome c biogenesis protein CcsA [Bacillota bacterium]
MIGTIALYLGFFSAIAAGVIFFLQSQNRYKKIETTPIMVWYFHVIAVAVGSFYLLHALLTHKFELVYVFNHTGLSLPTKYLVSAFWAGQEGSLLFWALCSSFIGLILIHRKYRLLAPLMTLFSMGQSFLLLFLILESPFTLQAVTPADGLGLNSLLMDPWMVIHPPIIFIGYALFMAPCVFAMAALWKKDFHEWFLQALPWACAAWLFLGVGIIVGGAWAYRVLGWGGYWGWDPVENASLIPWLTGGALVHGLLLQRQKPYLLRTNMFMAVTTFLLIIFATFLVRSGVMAGFSVHAFTKTALSFYLLLFLLCYALIGYGLLILRLRDIPVALRVDGYLSKGGSFSLTIFMLVISAALILVGTLSPLITGIFGVPSSVDETFYLKSNAPLMLLLFLLLAFCPVLEWKSRNLYELLSRFRAAAVVFPVGVIIGYWLGVKSVFHLVFIGVIALAMTINGVELARRIGKGLKFCGGYLAHLGLALMFIGIVGSMGYTQSQLLYLHQAEPAFAFGYEFTYLGHSQQEGEKTFNISVNRTNENFVIKPRMYLAGSMPRWMKEPYISRSFKQDLYLSPLELRTKEKGETVVTNKGDTFTYGDYSFLVKDLIIKNNVFGEVIEVGVVLEVTGEGTEDTLVPALRQHDDGWKSLRAKLADGTEIAIDEVDLFFELAYLEFLGKTSHTEEILIAEIKVKPLISMLIFGSIILIAGTSMAVWRRFTSKKYEHD